MVGNGQPPHQPPPPQPPDQRPSSGQPPPALPPAPKMRRATLLAVIATVLGWVIIGMLVGSWFATGEEVNCSAHSGADYNSCVRSGDRFGLVMQAVATGAAAFGIGLLVRDARRTPVARADVATWAFVGALAVVCGLLWLWGLPGGLAPDRPQAYEPISRTMANSIMAAGLAAGALFGALVPLRERPR